MLKNVKNQNVEDSLPNWTACIGETLIPCHVCTSYFKMWKRKLEM